MLFSNKKLSHSETNQFVSTIPVNANSKNFILIKKLYKIKKNAIRKNIFIAKMKKPFFLFYLKQWTLYTQTILKNNSQKTLLIHNPYINIPKTIQKKFLLKPKNAKTGFLTNFNVQKKEQFRADLNKLKELNFISINQLKNTKPNAFLFVQPEKNEIAINETQNKQFAVMAIENITSTTISEYPLFLNLFHHPNLLNKLLVNQIKTQQTKNFIKNLRFLFLQNQKILKKLKKIYSPELNTIQNNSKYLTKQLNNWWNNISIKLKKNKKFERRKWYKLTQKLKTIYKLRKISKRFRKLPLRRLKKQFYKNINWNTQQLVNIYNNTLTPWIYEKSYNWTLHFLQKKKKKAQFNFFFYRLNNLPYLKDAFLWNLINEQHSWKNSQNEFTQCVIRPLIQKTIPFLESESFNTINYKTKIKTIYKKIKFKTKEQKKTINEIPEFTILWRANENWLQEKNKKILFAAELYKQLNGKFPIWWEFPIKHYQDLYINYH